MQRQPLNRLISWQATTLRHATARLRRPRVTAILCKHCDKWVKPRRWDPLVYACKRCAPQAAHEYYRANRLVFGLPKTDKDRRVPVSAELGARIRSHMEQTSPVKVTLPWEVPGGEPTPVPLILTTSRRNAIKGTTFDALSWRPALLSAGLIPDRSQGMHALRHFNASTLLDAGESIKALAEFLGHSDPAFTLRRYAHLMPTSEQRTRAAIDGLFQSQTA